MTTATAITAHTPREFADALQALLPPGKAWEWPAGGLGDALLLGAGQEFSRIDAVAALLPNYAAATHKPIVGSWHISAYRKVAADAVGIAYGDVDTGNSTRSAVSLRKPFSVGAKVGQRLWSSAGQSAYAGMPIPLLQVRHLLQPFHVGSRVGDGLFSSRGRYVLLVRYYRSVIDPKALWDALDGFKQAHVYVVMQDITGNGGDYGSN